MVVAHDLWGVNWELALETIRTIKLILGLIALIGIWGVFKKAGEKPWKSLIPVYNDALLFKIGWRMSMFGATIVWSLAFVVAASIGAGSDTPHKTIIWFSIAAVFFAMMLGISIIFALRLGKAFGKGPGFIAGLILIPDIFCIILGWDKSKYLGPQDEKKPWTKDRKLKWAAAALLVAAGIGIEAYFVTTPGFCYKPSPLAKEIYSQAQKGQLDSFVEDSIQGTEVKSIVIKEGDGTKTILKNVSLNKDSDKFYRCEELYALLLFTSNDNRREITTFSSNKDDGGGGEVNYGSDMSIFGLVRNRHAYVKSPEAVQQLIETQTILSNKGW